MAELGTTLAIEARQFGDDGAWVVLAIEYPADGEREPMVATSRVPANIARKIAARFIDAADAADELNAADEPEHQAADEPEA